MLNLYETARTGLLFNRFEVGELLFVEYTCPIEEESMVVWSQSDYLVHVLSGKKSWRTPEGVHTISAGQTLFIKKGAAIINQFFDEDFCMLVFFISDEFICNTIREISVQTDHTLLAAAADLNAITVENTAIMQAYYQSMLTYFSGEVTPTNDLLILKIKELIINILSSPNHKILASYFKSLAGRQKISVRQIMETNFCYNLSLADFAKLCHCSLSTFKRAFHQQFGMTPGRWLIDKRLAYATILLQKMDLNISQIVFECGFEDQSHFSRVFKQKYGVSPNQYRKQMSA